MILRRPPVRLLSWLHVVIVAVVLVVALPGHFWDPAHPLIRVVDGAAEPQGQQRQLSYKDASPRSEPTPPPRPRRIIYEHDVAEYQPNAPLPCRDTHTECTIWAHAGGCTMDRLWMHPHCPVACQVCHTLVQRVSRNAYSLEVPMTAQTGSIILDAVGASLGIPQRLVEGHEESITARVQEARDYVQHTVLVEELYQPVRETCRTYDTQCAYWAIQGECESNAEFMNENCAPVCFTCEQLHVVTRCPIDPNEKNAWYAGDLNAMFESIVANPDFHSRYEMKVLSRPDYAPGDTVDTANDYILGPWILTLDNFLSAAEAERLIELGQAVGYERSTDVGAIQWDGSIERRESQGRTSMNAWCLSDECANDPVTNAVYERMQNLTHIPRANSEALQLLRYTESQFYNVHHDYIPVDISRKQGVRILTIFLYLNDLPDAESGGGTNFDRLNLTVNPKRGRALIWPSTLNDAPNEMDPATHHQALRVNKGIKYGANAWFHQRSYPSDCE